MANRRRRYLEEVVRRVAPLLLVFTSVYVGASVLFYWFQGTVSLFSAFYWGLVTLSTVGYGDIVPTTTPARLVTMVALVVQIFLLGYLLSVVTTVVTSEQQKRGLGLLGTDLKGHIVVLGYSAVGRAAVRELLSQEQKVAVVAQTADEVANIRSLAREEVLYVTYGHAGERDILLRANVPMAHSVVVCTSDDATNMIAALNVRAVAPSARIVVSVQSPELRDTLRAAGVTDVARPSDLGGRLCAMAAFEPDVADTIEDLSAGDVHADIQEYQLTERTPLTGRPFDAAAQEVRRETGCLLIGYARPGANGEFTSSINPAADVVLRSGDAAILLGTLENTKRFRHWFGIDQGR